MITVVIIGASIMLLSLTAGIISLVYMLAHIGMITPFKGEYKETEALLTNYTDTNPYVSASDPSPSDPILSYYNSYKGENVKKIFLNSGISSPFQKTASESEKKRTAQIGEKIKIQYTKHFERVVDERFVSPGKYKLSRYLTPVIISFACCAAGGVLLLIGIVMS
ncbi:MAG: hypothetical protein NC253_13640 [Ruminococcus sp.]|nr:hypothetical protein [Ruminococcus sp.]MCM1381583.1 hypothetical protein [Muribaculaceae bacterium]MCM1480050.1 hypothetical protein [Muribaculaceae bacterium]